MRQNPNLTLAPGGSVWLVLILGSIANLSAFVGFVWVVRRLTE